MSDGFFLNSVTDENSVTISPLKKSIFTAFLTILVIGLITLLGEIFVRIYYCWRFDTNIFLTEFFQENDHLVHRASDDPILGYELKPNFKGVFSRRQPNFKTGRMEAVRTEVETNSLGFRDKAYSRRKPPGTFRILVLGDSITFGLGVPQKKTFSNQLEILLNKPGNRLKFEVINCGITGYNAKQEVELFRTRGIRMFPDLIIINYVMNDQGGPDSGLLWYFNRRNRFLLKYALLKNYNQYFKSNRLEKVALKNTKAKSSFNKVLKKYRGSLVGNAIKSHDQYRLERFSVTLHRAYKVSKSRNVKQVMVIFPYSNDLTKEHPLKNVHQNVKIVAEENSFSVIDLWDTFIAYPPKEIYQENIHPNEKGLEIAAKAVYDFLIDNRLVPVLSKKRVVNY